MQGDLYSFYFDDGRRVSINLRAVAMLLQDEFGGVEITWVSNHVRTNFSGKWGTKEIANLFGAYNEFLKANNGRLESNTGKTPNTSTPEPGSRETGTGEGGTVSGSSS